MNKERLYQTIISSHVTEKTSLSNKQLVFKVSNTSTKKEIKEAVELLFKVEVESVRVLNIKGKRKTFRGKPGKRNDTKKAYVGLTQEIDYDELMSD